jgi:hypothetical protein
MWKNIEDFRLTGGGGGAGRCTSGSFITGIGGALTGGAILGASIIGGGLDEFILISESESESESS